MEIQRVSLLIQDLSALPSLPDCFAPFPFREQRRVNVDFPVWMIQCLDREAQRLGVARQALIKMVIAQHIEKAHA